MLSNFFPNSLGFLIFLLGIINGSHSDPTDFRYLIKLGYRPEEHPLAKYIVSIRRDYGFHTCGGSIYNERVIVTAAHCVVYRNKTIEPNLLEVLAGSPNRLDVSDTHQIIKVAEIRVHPQYNVLILSADIAMLILEKDLIFDGETVQAVELVNERLPIRTKCITYGWGCLYRNGMSPAVLAYLDVEIQPRNYCERFFRHYTDGMICLENRDDDFSGTCAGDSGGPTICGNKLVGVTSYGTVWGEGPEVMTDVAYYRNWIIGSPDNNGAKSPTSDWILIPLIVIYHLY